MSDEFTGMINQAIFKARDSKDGKRAVADAKKKEKREKNEIASLFHIASRRKDFLDSGDKDSASTWESHAAETLGVRKFDYDERFNNHILYVDDVMRYSEERADAFNTSFRDDNSITVLPYKHSSHDKMATPRERMDFDMTYFHEQSHAKGKSGDRQMPDEEYNTSQDWSRRPEELLADRGTLEVLKENMDRDGMPYSKEVGQQALLDYYEGEPVKNKSSLLYRDRMEYLPNPEDDMEARAKEHYSNKERRVINKYNQEEIIKIDNARELQLQKRDEEIKRRASGFNLRWGNIAREDRNLNRKLMATEIAEDFENRFIKSTEQE